MPWKFNGCHTLFVIDHVKKHVTFIDFIPTQDWCKHMPYKRFAEAIIKVSGTVIRGTPNTPKHGWKTSSKQTVKTGKHSSKLKPHLPRDVISSCSSPTSGKNVVPNGFTPRLRASLGSGRTPGSPEAKLGQTLSYNNLGQIALPPTVSHAHLMRGSPDTLS
jgi:hypothetical protein